MKNTAKQKFLPIEPSSWKLFENGKLNIINSVINNQNKVKNLLIN